MRASIHAMNETTHHQIPLQWRAPFEPSGVGSGPAFSRDTSTVDLEGSGANAELVGDHSVRMTDDEVLEHRLFLRSGPGYQQGYKPGNERRTQPFLGKSGPFRGIPGQITRAAWPTPASQP